MGTAPTTTAAVTGAGPPRVSAAADPTGLAGVVSPLPAQPVMPLDAGYDYQPCRQVLTTYGMVAQIAIRGVPARPRLAAGGVIERTHALVTSTASCAGAPSVAGWWWSSGWRWPAL